MAMVVNANRDDSGLGGHISTYASLATLYEVAFNHFFRGGDKGICRRHGLFSGHDSRAIMRARFWKAGWTKASCKISARNWPKAAGFPRIRIRI